jgi:DNA repair protein RadC
MLRLVRDAPETKSDIQLVTVGSVYQLMKPIVDQAVVEYFWVLPLDGRNHLIESPVIVSQGSVNRAIIYPREVFRVAIVAGAVSIVLVHNHPSGIVEPSPNDREITRQLVAAGKLLDIPVLDHIIIGNTVFSFADSGEL